jgi:hypothetical protein
MQILDKYRDVATCSPVEVYRCFKGAYCLHLQGEVESARTSETSVNFYRTTRRNIPLTCVVCTLYLIVSGLQSTGCAVRAEINHTDLYNTDRESL